MGILSEAVVDFLSESSLLLFWLGGWNLLCLVLPDDSVEVCLGLMLMGIVFRVVFFYFKSLARSLQCKKEGEGVKRRVGKKRLLYLRVYNHQAWRRE